MHKTLLKTYTYALFSLMVAHAVAAETPWPQKPIRIIVAFPPSGFVDIGTRIIAPYLNTALGQQVVVDNRGRAGGVVGTELAARAAPDGYTFTVGSVGTHAVNQTLYRNLPYHVLRDFQAVMRLADAPSLLAVHPSLPARNVKELIALAQQQPKNILYASSGSGTSTHLAAVLFESMAKVRFVHVPFKGGVAMIVAVVAGQAPVTFGTAATVSPHVRSGRERGLAVTGSKRAGILPDTPTIAEAGVPGYEMLNWLGLFAPTQTPRAIVDRLSGELLKILRTTDVRDKLNAAGAEPSAVATDEFAVFVKGEVEKWAKVVAATGMTVD